MNHFILDDINRAERNIEDALNKLHSGLSKEEFYKIIDDNPKDLIHLKNCVIFPEK